MGDFQAVRHQTVSFYTHTQSDAIKHITLLCICTQGNNATVAIPCWSGWQHSSTSSSSMNTFSTSLVWRKLAASTIATFSSLINKVEHNQIQPRLILDRWRCLPGTPNRPTRIFRSLSVRSPQTFWNLSSKETFSANSFEDVADTGNNALNWSNVLLVMNSWHRCLYLSTSFSVVVLWETRDTRIIVCNNHNYPVHVYAQQGYVFGHVGLCMCACTYTYMSMWPKTGCLRSYHFTVSVIYCSLIENNHQKGAHYAKQFLQGKKFGSILLTEQKKGSKKLYYGKPCFIYMQCSYAMLVNPKCKHVTAHAV